MTLIQSILMTTPLFVALAGFVIEVYQRENKACRMSRSLRGYAQKTLAEVSTDSFSMATFHAA